VKIVFDTRAWDDYCYWSGQDPKTFERINALINEIRRTPFTGTGKPEALKYNLTGFWSRRITGEHRLVYAVNNDELVTIQARYRYSKK
jgi:toxin YoeB